MDDSRAMSAAETHAAWDRALDEGIQQLLDSLDVAVFLLDAEGRFVAYRAGRLALAAPPEHFLGRRNIDVFSPELAARFDHAIAEARARGAEIRIEYPLELPPPTGRHHYEASFVATREGGTIVLVLDVTERARLQAERDASARRFRTLIERATDILYVLDRELTVRFWSPGATDALGWSAEEAVGCSGPTYLHPDDAAKLTPPELDLPGSIHRFEFRVRHKDGTYRLLAATVRNMLADPDVAGVIVNARDVTEERMQEARSAESQKLESIGRLAGGVAHDFNNMLTVILGCGEVVEQALEAGQLPALDDVREMLGAAGRARDLTTQLLAFARRQTIAPVVLDLDVAVQGCERMVRRLLGEDVVLTLVRASEPCFVHCDPAQLSQILLNLAANARDVLPRGGRLVVSTDTTVVSLDPGATPAPYARLRVSDDGPGMAPEVRAHIFEPFFTTKPVGQGTGLGLATVYGIVRRHGGAIRVESSPGKGTTFEVLFPLQPAPAEPQTATVRPSLRGHESVLLVEDDRAVASITARLLRRAGHPVQVAYSGAEALELVRRGEDFELVVCDVVMPGMDGPQTIEALRALSPRLRALFVSGYTRDAMVARGLEEGSASFLAKPFSQQSLLAAVREALARPLASGESSGLEA
ncbi:MAG: response regulator [Sandaracinus sp.]